MGLEGMSTHQSIISCTSLSPSENVGLESGNPASSVPSNPENANPVPGPTHGVYTIPMEIS